MTPLPQELQALVRERLAAFLDAFGAGELRAGEAYELAPGATVRQVDATTIEVTFVDNETRPYELDNEVKL